MRSNIFDRLSFLSLFLIIVLLPVFCLPFTNIPIETSKGLLLVVGLAACVIFWAIARFLDGKIILPKSALLVSGFGVVIVFLLSAFFSGSSSGNSQISLFGTMLDIGSFWFIFGGFVLMLMSSIIFRTGERAKAVLFGTILSSIIVLIFQSVHLFLPTITSLGVLSGKTGNILGSWNSLGLFAGFSSLMFLLVIEFFPISKTEKTVLSIFILMGILLAAAVNFPLIWVLLGVSGLIIFIYKVSINFHKNESGEGGEKKHFPIISFIVVVVSLLFFMSAGFLGSIIPNRLQISNTEVGPSLSATMSVGKGVLAKNPVFGIGPNRFGEAWAMYKPRVVNNTQFWDVSFNSGSGLLPTLIATTGGLGILAFFVFATLFLIIGVKSVFSSITKGINLDIMAFFVLSLYLFISSFFYSVGMVIFLLSLAFAGVFIGLAASSSSKEKGEILISFLNDHRKSFFSILTLILVLIASVVIAFKYVERFASVSYFGKALSAPSVALAEESINQALKLHMNDLYLRTYTQIYMLKLESLLKKGDALSDAEKADLQPTLDQVLNSAKLATTYNGSNYLNFQALGSVYHSLGVLGVKDVEEKAIESYKMAEALNPNNPGIKLSMAVVSNDLGKTKDAKDYAMAALAVKGDYVNALIFLSQIAKNEGNNNEAISYAEKALAILPANSDLIKYVESLKRGNIIAIPPEIPTPAPKKP